MANPLNFLTSGGSKAGQRDQKASTLWTTPWAWRTSDGLYQGHNGDVWLYRMIPQSPYLWEDPSRRLDIGSPLAACLHELAQTSKDPGVGITSLTKPREIHLLSITWDEPALIPPGTPPALSDFLDDILRFPVPVKGLVLGVKLWTSALTGAKGALKTLQRAADRTVRAAGPDWEAYSDDRRIVNDILRRSGFAEPPTPEVRRQMESWYSRGKTTDSTMYESDSSILCSNGDRLEMAVVRAFDIEELYAPDSPWAMTAITHPAGAAVVSVRAQLDPASVVETRIRRSQRRIEDTVRQHNSTGDLDSPELERTLQVAQDVERLVVSARMPMCSNTSIVLARRVEGDVTETYIDELRNLFGIEALPLENRQMAALDETLPTSQKRVNPFVQDVSINMLAHAGLQAHSLLGDGQGLLNGVSDPDGTLVFTNPLYASSQNETPALGIFGEPGSGKTFLASVMAIQAALAGLQTIFINPKPMDDLSGVARRVGGQVVNLSELTATGGYFDPFRFAETPEKAATIAGEFILTAVGNRGGVGALTHNDEIALLNGLRQGAEAGARCVRDALAPLQHTHPHVVEMIRQLTAFPLFSLGIGTVPMPAYKADKTLTLIQFDKDVSLPDPSTPAADYSILEKVSVAVVQLITRASMELLEAAQGGVLVMDEAWMFLQSREGLQAVQRLGRLGRSQNILPIFCTQKVADLLEGDANMESFMSRVFVMKMTDRREATAALKLCGLEATEARLDFLRNAGPKPAKNGQPGRPAMAIHRDLQKRHAAVYVGPFPESLRIAISTNPDDKKTRAGEGTAAA
jgi:hypothetical protein